MALHHGHQAQHMTTVCLCMQVATLCHPFVVPLVESWVDRGHTINMVSGYCKSGDLGALVHNPRVTSAVSSSWCFTRGCPCKKHLTVRTERITVAFASGAVALRRHTVTACRLQRCMRSAEWFWHMTMLMLPA